MSDVDMDMDYGYDICAPGDRDLFLFISYLSKKK
jgi:hypothetical protein